MGLFTGIIGAFMERCACITQPHFKKPSRKLKLNFLLNEIVACCSQEVKYSGFRKLN